MTTKYRPATRCRHASTYKAKRAPTCGCDVCTIKWQIAGVMALLTPTASQSAEALRMAKQLYSDEMERYL